MNTVSTWFPVIGACMAMFALGSCGRMEERVKHSGESSKPDEVGFPELSGPAKDWPAAKAESAPARDGSAPARGPASVSPDVRQFGIVKLYLATDRTWTGNESQPKWFNHTWNAETGHLTYGTCFVTIPVKRHETGMVEKPSVLRFEFTEDPLKHVIVRHPRLMEHETFFTHLEEEVKLREEKEIVIFIHGFNNTFDDAASRLGVLAYDMGFNGVPVLYSWCSEGGGGWNGTTAYVHDSQIIQDTIEPLTQFLAEVAQTGRTAGARRISVVAHSMGNIALVGAFKALADQHPGKVFFDEAVMAAPDVKESGFVTTVWPKLQKPARRVTLYASANDVALMASKKVSKFRRIGEGGDGLLVLPGLDTVDATGCDFTMIGLNHSYFGGKKVMSDLYQLTHQGLEPKDRKLLPTLLNDLHFWVFPE